MLFRSQTFCEPGFEFKVLADVCAVGHYFPLPETPHISIVPGEVDEWKAVLPSLRRTGEPFRLGLKAEDLWGNPTDRACETLILESNHPVQGLPDLLSVPRGQCLSHGHKIHSNHAGIAVLPVCNFV